MAHSTAVYAASRLISIVPRTRCSTVHIGAFGPTNGPTAGLAPSVDAGRDDELFDDAGALSARELLARTVAKASQIRVGTLRLPMGAAGFEPATSRV